MDTYKIKDISSEILLALSLGNVEKSYITIGSLLKAGAKYSDNPARKEIMDAYCCYLTGNNYMQPSERKSIRETAFKNYLTAKGFE